jgi:hypothetical protein
MIVVTAIVKIAMIKCMVGNIVLDLLSSQACATREIPDWDQRAIQASD